ncbi:Hypothetical protein, predicted transmembrane protein [Metamycoplasma auris 15026]|uniref:Uncharacterized protein n=1 Tax=Metamycoplasma auris 15026 TaxID=1188233 RepID=N9V9Z4_9BACT|nr:hypothetical protein [Metamycoplasma auris]ENY68523.1 Hypothetical protein, predicted transmembrane protein [Metamycoplasma auris 15026]
MSDNDHSVIWDGPKEPNQRRNEPNNWEEYESDEPKYNGRKNKFVMAIEYIVIFVAIVTIFSSGYVLATWKSLATPEELKVISPFAIKSFLVAFQLLSIAVCILMILSLTKKYCTKTPIVLTAWILAIPFIMAASFIMIFILFIWLFSKSAIRNAANS